jgi:hypothetical protein
MANLSKEQEKISTEAQYGCSAEEILAIEQVPIERITPDPNNPRFEDKELVEKLALNIKRDGLTRPLVLDRDFVIVSGHKQLQALRCLGWQTAPCIVKDFETKHERKRMNLAQNNLNGENDPDKLKLFVEDFKLEELELLGFGVDDISALLEPASDEVPALDEIHYRDEEKEKLIITFFHADKSVVLEKLKELSHLKGIAWYD